MVTVSSNLFLTRLNPDTEVEFSHADGAEIQAASGKPAKMWALLSSSALAMNFFDAWRPTTLEAKEFATLEWVDWFNHRRLLGPIGDVPPGGVRRAIL